MKCKGQRHCNQLLLLDHIGFLTKGMEIDVNLFIEVAFLSPILHKLNQVVDLDPGCTKMAGYYMYVFW